jgi:hypothetical protein
MQFSTFKRRKSPQQSGEPELAKEIGQLHRRKQGEARKVRAAFPLIFLTFPDFTENGTA